VEDKEQGAKEANEKEGEDGEEVGDSVGAEEMTERNKK
jgi:hypothetical protein